MISQMNEQLRRIVLSGTVREETAAQFLEQITALECVDVNKNITVYIDTYGGSIDSAITIYDAMQSCACPIVTVGIGKVMSAGVLILAAGEHGNRFITENTRVMIHEVSGGMQGPKSEMEVIMDELKRMQCVYVDLLSKHTGTSKEQLEDDMRRTRYMTAKDAKKYGIVDVVVPTRNINNISHKDDKKKKKKKKKA